LFITTQHAAFDFDSAPPALMFDHLGIGEMAEQNKRRPAFCLALVPIGRSGRVEHRNFKPSLAYIEIFRFLHL